MVHPSTVLFSWHHYCHFVISQNDFVCRRPKHPRLQCEINQIQNWPSAHLSWKKNPITLLPLYDPDSQFYYNCFAPPPPSHTPHTKSPHTWTSSRYRTTPKSTSCQPWTSPLLHIQFPLHPPTSTMISANHFGFSPPPPASGVILHLIQYLKTLTCCCLSSSHP